MKSKYTFLEASLIAPTKHIIVKTIHIHLIIDINNRKIVIIKKLLYIEVKKVKYQKRCLRLGQILTCIYTFCMIFLTMKE